MSEKTIMILMGILTAGFLGVTAFHFVSSDHTAPKITIPDTEITYTEGDDVTTLLEGVTANDNKNGDVSDYICIDTIVPNEEQKTATVVYAAYDFSNNVAKEKRTVRYVSVQQPDASAEEMPEEITAEESEEETADDPEENTEAAENTQVNPEAPVLTMEVHEFTIQAGGPFTPKNRILSAEDDVDNSDYLISHLQVDGYYDVDMAGRYELTYYVVDSSGNESNHEPMTLIVEESTNTQNTDTQNENTQNENTQNENSQNENTQGQTAPQSNPADTVTP